MAYGSVSQMILDVLQRAPKPGEVAAYQARLDNASLTQAELANELIDGIAGNREALDVVFPVLRFYQGVYGRVPDKGGLAYWVGVYRDIYGLDNPATPTQNEALVALARPFVDPVLTPEFLERYGPPPTSYSGFQWQAYASNFIDKLYLNVLQRQADTVGLLYWTGEFLAKFAELRTAFLAQGRTETEAALEARAIYIEQFTNSQEMKDATASVIRSFLTGAAQDPAPPNLYTGSLFNDPPVANTDSYDGVEDETLVIPVATGVLANDIDPDYGQTLTAAIVTNPSVGSLSFNANGSFNYTPAANYNGTVTFTYRVGDGLVLSAPATVTMTIASVFDPPIYSVAVLPSSVAEGNSGLGATLTYTITRVGDLDVAGSVALAFSGSATQGLDYTVTGLTGGAAVFAAGASTATVTVTTTPDTVLEPDETVIATLGAITGGGTLGTATATGTIADDDPLIIDLANLETAGFRISGAAEGDFSGWSVSAAGDVNGDGIGDLLVGAPFASPASRVEAGAAYVVFGRQPGAAWVNLDLANLGTAGVRITGAAQGDRIGRSVSQAGDINGDGVSDILISAPNFDPNGRSDAGATYVVFGRPSGTPWSNLDLANLGTAGVQITGAAAGDASGWSVSAAGDVNGDGIGDLLIGAPGANPNGRSDAGATYVVFGRPSGTPWSNLDLANLGTAGIQIAGAAAGDASRGSASAAGDVNGDGIADILIRAPGADPNGRDGAGATYVVFGRPSGTTWIDLDLANLGAAGVRIAGAAAGDESGLTVAAAGDVNGDGIADILIGARSADPAGREAAGVTYVVFGRPLDTPWTNLDLANLGTAGVSISGGRAGDQSGGSVSAAGDVNGDSIADVIIGAYDADPNGRTEAGVTYVVFGRPASKPWINLDLANLGTAGVQITGAAAGDLSGWSVSAAGDVNGDGIGDIAIGAIGADPNGQNLAGAVNVVFGGDFYGL